MRWQYHKTRPKVKSQSLSLRITEAPASAATTAGLVAWLGQCSRTAARGAARETASSSNRRFMPLPPSLPASRLRRRLRRRCRRS
jgi:hypothetical protein